MNHIALITGGSRGLGKSMALQLADRGVDVVLTYVSNRAAAEAVVAEVERKGRKAIALRLDVGDIASFEAFAAEVRTALKEKWDRPSFDYLVNNGGVGRHALFAETSEAQFEELLGVHFRGPFFLTQKLLPLIADGGRILNVSTGLTRFSFPGYAAYAAMKGAMDVLTHYLAKELAARRIRANSLAPGAIETDFGGGRNRDDKAINQHIASLTALGRVGLPDDIGGAVAMLLSPESGWINGQRIEVSGGIFL